MSQKSVQSMNKFPTKSIQRFPFQIPGARKIIYCTRYEAENVNKCGIFDYDIETEQHKVIKLWKSVNYYPRWNVSIYNKTEHSIIFVGGVDMTNNKKKYESIMIYNIETNIMKNIDFKTIGGNSRIILTNDDKYLHIIGGRVNRMHIRYNLLTNESNTIHSFHDTISYIQAHALLYNPLSNRLMLFGGRTIKTKTYHDGFWILDLNDTISSLSVDQRSLYLVSGYITQLINNTDYKQRNHDMFFAYILMFLGDDINISVWKFCATKKMPRKMCQFGYILYNNRIIITFGGRTENGSIDNIYYMDTFDDNSSWKEAAVTIPKRGGYNAVLIDNKTVHLLPFYNHYDHFYVDINKIISLKPPSWKTKRMENWSNKEILDWIKNMNLESQWNGKVLNIIQSNQCVGEDIVELESADDIGKAFEITDNKMLCKRLYKQIKHFKAEIPLWKTKRMKNWSNKEILDWIKNMNLENQWNDKVLNIIQSNECVGEDIVELESA
eukprot:360545_1